MSSNNINFNLIKKNKCENGAIYKIVVNAPISLGWIEDMTFNIIKGNHKTPYKLDYKKTENEKAVFEKEIFLETRAIYHFDFECLVDGQKRKFENEDYKISVNFETPDWAKGKIMYHIFVDRFYRGNKEKMKPMPRRTIHDSFLEEMIVGPNEFGIWNADFYGGDLKGIEEKLDYIKSLGVSILYLSPIVHSQSNHRYDASDFENVDPYAGCNDDLRNLCNKAHEMNIKVVLDAVFNHTGNDSKYFNEYKTFENEGAFQSLNSKYSSFFKKINNNGHITYDYWWGMKNLPVCDGYSKTWRNYILGENGIIDKWFNLGIDGLRLDVADELNDDFIEGIRIAVKRNKKDGFILGEVWKNPMRMNRGYIESGKGMDSVMNYTLVDALIRYFKYADNEKLFYTIKDILKEYPDDTISTLMNFTSTHDISRAINIFSTNEFQEYGEWAWDLKCSDIEYCKNNKITKEQYEKGKELYKVYIFALTFLPGILSIFYGDEAGVEGLGNLANRKTFPWGREDKELVEYFKEISKIRNEEKFLEKAKIKVVEINKDQLLFERILKNEKMLIAINRTNEYKKINIPDEYKAKQKIYSLKNNNENLAPYGAFAIKK